MKRRDFGEGARSRPARPTPLPVPVIPLAEDYEMAMRYLPDPKEMREVWADDPFTYLIAMARCRADSRYRAENGPALKEAIEAAQHRERVEARLGRMAQQASRRTAQQWAKEYAYIEAGGTLEEIEAGALRVQAHEAGALKPRRTSSKGKS